MDEKDMMKEFDRVFVSLKKSYPDVSVDKLFEKANEICMVNRIRKENRGKESKRKQSKKRVNFAMRKIRHDAKFSALSSQGQRLVHIKRKFPELDSDEQREILFLMEM